MIFSMEIGASRVATKLNEDSVTTVLLHPLHKKFELACPINYRDGLGVNAKRKFEFHVALTCVKALVVCRSKKNHLVEHRNKMIQETRWAPHFETVLWIQQLGCRGRLMKQSCTIDAVQC